MLFRSRSIDVGAVRMTERHLRHDPPRPEELLNAIGDAQDLFDDLVREHPEILRAHQIIGVAGTIVKVHIEDHQAVKAGDVLILGKPLGVGVLSAALKKGALDGAGYAAMLASTTQLNTPGQALAEIAGVHALTDVTGFGLLGHAREMALGAQLRARIQLGSVPLLPNVEQLAAAGFITGASARNWAGYQHDVKLETNITPVQQALLVLYPENIESSLGWLGEGKSQTPSSRPWRRRSRTIQKSAASERVAAVAAVAGAAVSGLAAVSPTQPVAGPETAKGFL